MQAVTAASCPTHFRGRDCVGVFLPIPSRSAPNNLPLSEGRSTRRRSAEGEVQRNALAQPRQIFWSLSFRIPVARASLPVKNAARASRLAPPPIQPPSNHPKFNEQPRTSSPQKEHLHLSPTRRPPTQKTGPRAKWRSRHFALEWYRPRVQGSAPAASRAGVAKIPDELNRCGSPTHLARRPLVAHNILST